MNRISLSSLLLLALGLGACLNGGPSPDSSESPSGLSDAPAGSTGRQCRAEALYVDLDSAAAVPSSMAGAGGPKGYRSRVADALRAEARAHAMTWFAGRCASKDLFVEHWGVLEARPKAVLSARADAEDRFHRFAFECRPTSGKTAPLGIEDEYLCEAIESLRTLAEARAGDEVTTYVGRECEGLGLGNTDTPSPEMKTWHLSALGLHKVRVPSSAAARARLSLVDSGVPSALLAPLDVVASPDFGPTAGVSGHASHGAAMASLVRQLAPDVEIYAPRVLDAAGMGTSESIARGLDESLFGTSSLLPQVIQLSLGWTPRLARRTALTGRSSAGGTCASYEDPFGEPVKFLLGLARLLDDQNLRRVFVVAAAGNQTAPAATRPGLDPVPPPVSSVLPPSRLPAPLSPTCHGELAQPWFLPAGYGAANTCIAGQLVTDSAYPVSPIRFDNRRSQLAVETETRLVAVGEHVFASAPSTPNPNLCSASFPLDVRLPVALSGSSVSAAFTAATAARVQQVLQSQGLAPLGWNALGAFLEHTGQPLCRYNARGEPMVRLDAGRAEHAALHCPQLAKCVESRASCAPEAAACFGGTPACATEVTPPPLGSQTAAMCTVTRRRSTTTVAAGSTCGSNCTAESGFERYALAGAGPQPTTQVCPYCVANLFAIGVASIYEMTTWFEISPELEGSTISNPQMHLVFVGPSGTEERWVNLDGVTQPGDWFAGNTVELVMPVDFNLPSGFVVDNVKAELDLLIESTYGDSEPAVDSNPLVVELN